MKPVQKRLIVSNLFLFTGLFVLISINKDYLRPAFIGTTFLEPITGCLPNFLAAFIISLAIVNIVLTKKLKLSRLIVYSVSIVVFLLLAFEEILPLWGASEIFDKLDILASGIGSLLAIIIFEIVKKRMATNVKV